MLNITDLALNTLFLYLIVLNFFLAGFILFRHPKKRINQSFALLCFTLSIWIFSLFVSRSFENSSLIWLKIGFFTQIVIIMDAWYLSFLYPVKESLLKSAALIFGTSYFLIFLGLLFFSPFWLDDFFNYGNGFLLFITISWIPISWTVINFYRKINKVIGLEKVQLKYILTAYVFWAISANFLASLFNISGNSLATLAFSGLSSLVLSTAIFYAIARYRLLDIRFIVSKAIVYSLLALLVIIFYTFVLYVFGLFFYQAQFSEINMMVSLSLTLLIVLTIFPIKKSLEKVTYKTFFKNRINREMALQEFSSLFFENIKLDRLSSSFSYKLRQTLNLEQVHFVSWYKNKVLVCPEKANLLSKDDYQKILNTKNKITIFDDLEGGELKDQLRKLNTYYLYIYKKKDFSALFLLGYKLNGDIYYDDERSFLEILLPQFFISLERVLIFEKLGHFNQSLQTKVKQATGGLSQTNKDLKKALVLKDELISIVSHELVVPMVAISGSITTILEGFTGKVSAKTKDFLESIYNENTRLIRLTKNLLNISRIRSGRLSYDLEKFNPGRLFEEVVEIAEPLAEEKGLKILLKPFDSKLRVLADRDKLKEILINLVDNSIKYTQKGQISLGFEKDANKILCYVQDTGKGMSRSKQKELFLDPDLLDRKKIFTKKSRGLGLYICQNLLQGMKGELKIESQTKKGSLFSFWLSSA